MNIDIEKLRLQMNDLLYAVAFIFREDNCKELQESLEIVFLSYLFPDTFKLTDFQHIEKIRSYIQRIHDWEWDSEFVILLFDHIDELEKFLDLFEKELDYKNQKSTN